MIDRLATTFLGCIVAGCVTVTEQEMSRQFDHINAADARIALGLGYLDAGNRLKAKENLELAIKYAPNYYRSLNSIAYYYQLVGEVKLAEDAYKKAIRESPENSELLNNFGVFLCRLGHYREADTYFNRAIKQPLNYLIADSFENAAICSLKSGDKEQAKHYLERSLDYEPARQTTKRQRLMLSLQADEKERTGSD